MTAANNIPKINQSYPIHVKHYDRGTGKGQLIFRSFRVRSRNQFSKHHENCDLQLSECTHENITITEDFIPCPEAICIKYDWNTDPTFRKYRAL